MVMCGVRGSDIYQMNITNQPIYPNFITSPVVLQFGEGRQCEGLPTRPESQADRTVDERSERNVCVQRYGLPDLGRVRLFWVGHMTS